MMIRKEKNGKILLVVGVLIVIVVTFIFLIFSKKKNGDSFLETIIPQTSEQRENQMKSSNQILVQTDTKIERVDIASGKIEPASALEAEDFSGFEGLPKLGEDGKESTQQGFVLISNDFSRAIVKIDFYDQVALQGASDEPQSPLRSSEFVCVIAEKKCEPSELLSQKYQDLDLALQKQYGSLWWSAWDSVKNLLYGNLSDESVGNASPVYVCNTEEKSCQKTEGFDSLNPKEKRAVVPIGFFSPSLEKFVMINQYDKYNEQTGKRWEAIYYRSDDLSKSALRYDISLAIDGSENVIYDSVQSVAWSQDEKKIAFATSHKIVMLDFTTGKLQFVYDSPFDEETGYSFDGNELAFSGDGKFIVFAETEDNIVGEGSEEELDIEVINVIKKIDLTKNNEVSELMRGSDLSLKM